MKNRQRNILTDRQKKGITRHNEKSTGPHWNGKQVKKETPSNFRENDAFAYKLFWQCEYTFYNIKGKQTKYKNMENGNYLRIKVPHQLVWCLMINNLSYTTLPPLLWNTRWS